MEAQTSALGRRDPRRDRQRDRSDDAGDDAEGPATPHMVQSNWNRARRDVGIEHIHLHDLRHLAGTLAASTGAGTKELMHRLGHASPQAALRYQHATWERDVAIADAIDGLITS